MPLVTLTSDLGNCDYYSAALKGTLLRDCGNVNIIEIASGITPFDVRHAAYVVRNAYPYFAPGTIHIVYMNPAESEEQMIVIKHHEQYFITFNNGLISLMFQEVPAASYLISKEISRSTNLFFAEGMARIVNHILEGKPLEGIGAPSNDIRRLILMQPMVSNGFVKGTIQYFDKYGNAVSNITAAMIAQAIGEKRAVVSTASGDVLIGKNYAVAPPGEMVSFINAEGNLEIAINKGNAFKLLGLRIDSSVTVSGV